MGVYENFPKENVVVLKDTQKIDTMYHEYVYGIKLIEKRG